MQPVGVDPGFQLQAAGVGRLHQQGQGVKAGALPLGAGAKMAERVIVAGIEGITKGAHLGQHHGGPQISDIVEHGGNIC